MTIPLNLCVVRRNTGIHLFWTIDLNQPYFDFSVPLRRWLIDYAYLSSGTLKEFLGLP